MASLELRNQKYRVVFMHAGRKYGYSLNTANLETAEALRGGVEKTLMLIENKAIPVPEEIDIVDFVKAGGKVDKSVVPVPRITFSELQKRYLETHANGAMEANSLVTVRIHLRHFAKMLGDRFKMQELALSNLQDHLNERSKKKYRGRRLSPSTLRKEIATLRAVWNWADHMGLVKGPFPSKGLVYAKSDEKPPFMSKAEIERRLPGLSKAEAADAWQALYLDRKELNEFLEFVRTNAGHPWIYPMICTAAHTGARRSELLRMYVSDLDLSAGSLIIREKKRSRKQRTTRRAPVTEELATVLKGWLAIHPGGQQLFCQNGEVARSRTRSATTGHRSGKFVASKERTASVRRRGIVSPAPLTEDECHDHFKRTIADSRWKDVRGFHVLRHSFISCLASAGVDQRVIDEIVGHQTDEQRKRYRHLYPAVVHEAISKAFRKPS